MPVFAVTPLKPRFKALPEFNPALTPQEWQRVKQHLDAGKDYRLAVRTTAAEFKAWRKAKAESLKAAQEAPALP